jgi:hypothetical protein
VVGGEPVERKKHKDKRGQKSIVNACVKACKSFSTSLPMLLGIILLMGLFRTFVSSEMISSVFSGKIVRDTFIGTLIGSISAGKPKQICSGNDLQPSGMS